MPREIVTSENRDEYIAKKLGKKREKDDDLVPIYHSTSKENEKKISKKDFDTKHSADGSVWFSSHPDIENVAATGKGATVKRYINKKKLKLGGWDETDKYGIDELIQQGYHGLELPRSNEKGHTYYQIFHPDKLDKD